MANRDKRKANSREDDLYSPLATRHSPFANSLLLLHALALARALLEQLQIVQDVGIVRSLGLGLQQGHTRARIVAAQHVRVALVVEHFRGLAEDANGLVVGA